MDELSIDSETHEKITTKGFAETTTMSKARQLTSRPHFRIDWRDLTYYSKSSSFCFGGRKSPFTADDNSDKPKRILNSLDGCFKSGELSAILGPSGAGKTTFLSSLFGNKQDDAYGRTKVTWIYDENHVDGSDLKRPLRIAVLPQHDHLLHHLTVFETMMFASKIKNANRTITSKDFHRKNVKRVTKMLKLGDCLNTRCGKLSGGQYKRVSIGQELLSEPDVIILDEPTSGLDAMTCLTTVRTLKSVATKHPISIILTIHQPDIDVFNIFDHVYVIAQGGLAIYEGPPSGIEPTLASVNLTMPTNSYNPARFIVEHAFINDTEQRSFYDESCGDSESEMLSNDSDGDDEDEHCDGVNDKQGYIRRSVLSLTEAIGGEKVIRRDKKPLLNIGIRTLDGTIITNEQLVLNRKKQKHSERLQLLRRLNSIQRARYNSEVDEQLFDGSYGCGSSSNDSRSDGRLRPDSMLSHVESTKSDYSSSGWSSGKATCSSNGGRPKGSLLKASSVTHMLENSSPPDNPEGGVKSKVNRSLQTMNLPLSDEDSALSTGETEFVVNMGEETSQPDTITQSGVTSTTKSSSTRRVKLRRQFDKRLSAKHSCSKRKGNPTYYHAFLLTHRTWLSIIRDPVFFGIQACMHTTIPVLLALIFGTSQEEGCPRVGNFDLVEFAYSDSEDMIQNTVTSIRKSIGNIGTVFFEMFVVSFAINCITALVFPLDMYVLLKEYRNGWYSLRSYFFGRTLADLPLPVILHSLAMTILCYLTSQPLSMWRFSAIIVLVMLASLVAQSIGLTIGALLMKSSQSAVLAAAAIVAPIFALSGFIVRIHVLPWIAQIGASASYLYHVLNGFIILRYGFGRCQCSAEDFERGETHKLPANLKTMASIWIGTFSDEYSNSPMMVRNYSPNKTNIDPNIDVVEKMMTAFRLSSSYGHQIATCDDVLPYAMLDFNLRDHDIYGCFIALGIMLIVSRFITFAAIYYKIRSFA